MSAANDLYSLFKSNDRSIGLWDPRTGKMRTEYRSVTPDDFKEHLAGSYGIGLVPIRDDDTCYWGAIDIDNHGQEEDLDISAVVARIASMGLPLLACRSKSGGIHCYLFLEDPIPAASVRNHLARWANDVGYAGAEIFPKQSRLASSAQGKQLGNWINLPYFAGAETNRACYKDKILSIEEFVSEAKRVRTNGQALAQHQIASHADAPPCVQRMMVEGVASGYRNEALYQAVVYFRKRNPEDYSNQAIQFNASTFSKPLSSVEAKRTIASAGRPNYAYRCSEEPSKSLCDRATCITRKFGITPEVAENLEAFDSLPEFTDLTKYNLDPVKWSIKVDGVEVYNLTTRELMTWQSLREAVAERLMRVVPEMKKQAWDTLLNSLMKSARVQDAPDDASASGIIRGRLLDFMSRAAKHVNDRAALLRGMPTLLEDDDGKRVVFRGRDFVDYLRRNRTEDLKGPNMWFAVRTMGVESKRLRVTDPKNPSNKDPIDVWVYRLDEAKERELFGNTQKGKEYKSDI